MAVKEPTEWGQGWKVVVGAAIGMGTGYGLLMMTSGLFLKPMQEEFGWSRTALSFLPIISIISALMLPLTGYLLDRLGSRLIAICGLLCMVLGYLFLAFVPANAVLFYAAVIFMGLIVSATGGISWTRGVATWFLRNRGTAFGIAMCGTSVISAIAMPILSGGIENYGWRACFLSLAGITLFLGIPVAFVYYREKPRQTLTVEVNTGNKDKPGFRIALVSPRFWLLFTCFALISLPLGGFMIHLMPILTDIGVTVSTAAKVVSAFAMSIAVGRVIAGFLLDRIWPPGVAASCFFLPVLGVVFLKQLDSSLELSWLVAGCAGVLIGFAQGAEADFIAYFTARYFPLEIYSRVFSLIAFSTYTMISLGGLLFSALYDFYGNHNASMLMAMACYLLGGSLILMVEKIRQ